MGVALETREGIAGDEAGDRLGKAVTGTAATVDVGGVLGAALGPRGAIAQAEPRNAMAITQWRTAQSIPLWCAACVCSVAENAYA